MGHAFECEYCESFHTATDGCEEYERQRRKKHTERSNMKNINIKKGDFVRPIFAPRVFLCIEEKVIDLDTNEPYFWASDEDGGEFELVPEEIVEVISGDKMADCRWSS